MNRNNIMLRLNSAIKHNSHYPIFEQLLLYRNNQKYKYKRYKIVYL